MSVLAIQIPPRPRLASRQGGDVPPAAAAAEYEFVLSPDGLAVGSSGRAAPALLPKADSVVAVLADADVGWHRLTLPKAPAARMRMALGGVLEEALLDDDAALHLALPPRAAGGSTAWVAAVHKPWLAAHLAALDGAGLPLDRVVPAAVPGDAAAGHFFNDGPEAEAPMLSLVHADGAATVRLAGSLARALLPQQRQRQPFRNIEDIKQALPEGMKVEESRIGVRSDFFDVYGRLRLEDRILEQHSLVERRGAERGMEVVTLLRERQHLPTTPQ